MIYESDLETLIILIIRIFKCFNDIEENNTYKTSQLFSYNQNSNYYFCSPTCVNHFMFYWNMRER